MTDRLRQAKNLIDGADEFGREFATTPIAKAQALALVDIGISLRQICSMMAPVAVQANMTTTGQRFADAAGEVQTGLLMVNPFNDPQGRGE